MSKMSESARAAAKSKAERLVRADPTMRVDASGYRPDGAMNADVVTGMRPVSRRAYRSGGKVSGDSSAPRADRKPRASGGRTLTAESLINRNVKDANEDRGGLTHVGGMKRGGHVDEAQDRKLITKVMHEKGCGCGKCSGGRVAKKDGGAINDGTRPVAGRLARKGGGRAKKGTNVNIIITQPGGMNGPAPPPGAMPPPPGGPVGLHQGAPPPAVAAPGAPPPGMMPMARKDGGRTLEKDGGKLAKPGAYPIDTGAGGGLGRLEKAGRAARG